MPIWTPRTFELGLDWPNSAVSRSTCAAGRAARASLPSSRRVYMRVRLAQDAEYGRCTLVHGSAARRPTSPLSGRAVDIKPNGAFTKMPLCADVARCFLNVVVDVSSCPPRSGREGVRRLYELRVN